MKIDHILLKEIKKYNDFVKNRENQKYYKKKK